MSITEVRNTLSDWRVVKEIKEELNQEICYCPILRNLEREYSNNVIDNREVKFRDLGAEDRN